MHEPRLPKRCASERPLEEDSDYWMRARFKICLTDWNDDREHYSSHVLVVYVYCCIML